MRCAFDCGEREQPAGAPKAEEGRWGLDASGSNRAFWICFSARSCLKQRQATGPSVAIASPSAGHLQVLPCVCRREGSINTSCITYDHGHEPNGASRSHHCCSDGRRDIFARPAQQPEFSNPVLTDHPELDVGPKLPKRIAKDLSPTRS